MKIFKYTLNTYVYYIQGLLFYESYYLDVTLSISKLFKHIHLDTRPPWAQNICIGSGSQAHYS
jgi:hypothetical protein